MKYLLLSQHKPTFNEDLALWWAPDCMGYTVDVDKAGRYGAADAKEICSHGDAAMISIRYAKKITRKVVIFGDVDHRIRPKRK